MIGAPFDAAHPAVDDGWFHVEKVSDRLFAISEPRHYEHTVIYLLIGETSAVLIDTGCGIGDLRRVVKQLTTLPVLVINTHSHLDHVGGNRQFSDIAMFDHPRARHIASMGAFLETVTWELTRPDLVTSPWPENFDHDQAAIAPFGVSRWLEHGELISLGEIELTILHTPGEAPDHICLLDRSHRTLFSGDILLGGPVWAHLEGGDVAQLEKSYQLLMRYFGAFDILMPSHNGHSQDKQLLPTALAGARDILRGHSEPDTGVDPWGRPYDRYDFDGISILQKPGQGRAGSVT